MVVFFFVLFFCFNFTYKYVWQKAHLHLHNAYIMHFWEEAQEIFLFIAVKYIYEDKDEQLEFHYFVIIRLCGVFLLLIKCCKN